MLRTATAAFIGFAIGQLVAVGPASDRIPQQQQPPHTVRYKFKQVQFSGSLVFWSEDGAEQIKFVQTEPSQMTVDIHRDRTAEMIFFGAAEEETRDGSGERFGIGLFAEGTFIKSVRQ